MVNIEIHGYCANDQSAHDYGWSIKYCGDLRDRIFKLFVQKQCYSDITVSIVMDGTLDFRRKQSPFLRIFWTSPTDIKEVTDALDQIDMDMQIISLDSFIRKASERQNT